MILPSLVVSLKQGRISSQHLDHVDSLLRLTRCMTTSYSIGSSAVRCWNIESCSNIDMLPILALTTLGKPLKGDRILTVLWEEKRSQANPSPLCYRISQISWTACLETLETKQNSEMVYIPIC